jgi:aerotaxis receptor
MSKTPAAPVWREVKFEEEGFDARALVTRTDTKGRVTFASKAYREMTGYSKNELVGRSHSVVRHPFMPRSVFREMWDTIRQGKHFSGLVMNMRKDGRYYWVEVKIDAIDADGNIISSMASVGENVQKGYNNKQIHGYVAIRREPTRNEVKEATEYYRQLRKEELRSRMYLKEWEKEILKVL